VQKLLGEINYLRCFISNLAGNVDSFLPLLHLKHENEFVWGAELREAFERIKAYLMSPPVLWAPNNGKGFKLYIGALECIVGVVHYVRNSNRRHRSDP
jgi:hypothetical protein